MKKKQLNPAKEHKNRTLHEFKLKTPNRKNLDMFLNSKELGNEMKRWRREELMRMKSLVDGHAT